MHVHEMYMYMYMYRVTTVLARAHLPHLHTYVLYVHILAIQRHSMAQYAIRILYTHVHIITYSQLALNALATDNS